MNPFYGPFCLAGVHALSEIFFIPGSILTVGAGWAFKEAYHDFQFAMIVGSVSSQIGAMVGAVMTFLLGRYVFYDTAVYLAQRYDTIKALDSAIRSEGFKLMFLLRLSPIVPFTMFNFIMGITNISFCSYTLGLIGLVPSTVMFVFLGTTLSNFQKATEWKDWENNKVFLIFMISGTALALIGVIWVSIVARRHLREAIEISQKEDKSDESLLRGNNPNEGGNEENQSLLGRAPKN